MVRFILSVDGGGIRGIIPALILAEIERRVERPLGQIFDLIVGCSTGGIIGAGLSLKTPYAPNDLVNLYDKHGADIFKARIFKHTYSWIRGVKYSHNNLENVLDSYFKDSTMSDVSSKLMILSYDITNNSPCFFKSWRPETNQIMIKDALRASTAAPTYFIPQRLVISEIERVLVDGGVIANNPSCCAYASAKRLFPNDDYILLSIGTGLTKTSIKFPQARYKGRIAWIAPLVQLLFDAGLRGVNYQMTQILNDNYIRIQVDLTHASTDLDNVSSENIQNLRLEATKAIKENSEKISRTPLKYQQILCMQSSHSFSESENLSEQDKVG